MANLQEKLFWEPGIYQLETSDPVLAGPDGIDNLQGKQLANRTAYLKDQVEQLASGKQPAGNAAKLSAARKIEATGDGNWNVVFDGSKDVSVVMTLRDSGVTPGDYGIVTVDAKGRVTKARQMSGDDVPAHDWGKVVSGKPTTLAGYGIVDAAGKDQDGRVWGSAFRAKKGDSIGSDASTTGYAFESDGDTGLFAIGGAGSNLGTQELQLKIDNQALLSVTKNGLWSAVYGWLHEKFAAKATTLAGYGIVDAASASDLSKVAAKINSRRMVRVRASGYSVKNGMAGVEIDGVAVGPVARNYNMVQLDVTGTVNRAATFDLAGSSGQDKVAADWLNAAPDGATVIVYTFDEPQGGRLTGGFPQAMYRCGASSQVFASDKFQYRSAYILIGRAGCGEGQGVERYRGDAPGSTDAQLDVAFELVSGLPLLGSSQINGSVIPTGQIAYFASDKAPSGWLKCDGSYVPKASYASLYAVIQDRFPNPDPKRPNADPNNLFCLPELRGEFIRSLDDGRGVDAGRLAGASQAQSIEAHGHGINTIEVFNTAAFIINDNSGDGVVSADNSGPGISNLRTGRYFTERTGGGETRPRNVALLACIKY
ncbi:tail fiber protein [Chromobacterium vaccinii]|uniref:tail fiber protein n=1 Tax=Chromobacterium vaccinii TaxID=1108595 RepID=UPI001E467B89|nr:tail fiber protein [Chromobacterium vaccinii]MCD4502053.1 tail fiber protein [Chromobacterium vaccinii]